MRSLDKGNECKGWKGGPDKVYVRPILDILRPGMGIRLRESEIAKKIQNCGGKPKDICCVRHYVMMRGGVGSWDLGLDDETNRTARHRGWNRIGGHEENMRWARSDVELHIMMHSLSLPPLPFESSPSGFLCSTDPGPPGWMIGVSEFAFRRCVARLSPFSAARLNQEIALWSDGNQQTWLLSKRGAYTHSFMSGGVPIPTSRK